MAEAASPYRILERKRAGKELTAGEIRDFVTGACDGTWGEAQIAAFLMATAIRGMSAAETGELTLAMLDSGERWGLGDVHPGLMDKHSTGGVGDKVSMILAPLLASVGLAMAKLTGRGLGHTGGTADKLESIPGLRLDLSRLRVLELLDRVGMAVAIATRDIAPADKRLYALRNLTATVDCLPLVVGSILSKKLALGASVLIFDVKAGSGSFFCEESQAIELGQRLIATAERLGTPATALVTDMNQPLGEWVGNACEVNEALRCLEGKGDDRLVQVCIELALALGERAAVSLDEPQLRAAISSGSARERFSEWAAAQGAKLSVLDGGNLPLAPIEVVATSASEGFVTSVDSRALGVLLLECGAGQVRADTPVDHGVSLRYRVRIGDRVSAGQELARLYLRSDRPDANDRLTSCFTIGPSAVAPPQLVRRLDDSDRASDQRSSLDS